MDKKVDELENRMQTTLDERDDEWECKLNQLNTRSHRSECIALMDKKIDELENHMQTSLDEHDHEWDDKLSRQDSAILRKLEICQLNIDTLKSYTETNGLASSADRSATPNPTSTPSRTSSSSDIAPAETLERELSSLKNRVFNMDVRLVECEQYSRRESLIISGIPSHVTQNQLESYVLTILAEIGLDRLDHNDITACHRLGRSNGRYPAKVIVRFINRKVVEFCLRHRDRLPTASRNLRLNLRFYESLCAMNEEALRICKWLSEQNVIHHYYLRNGFVKVIVEEGDNPVRIVHPEYLWDKFPEIPETLLTNNR